MDSDQIKFLITIQIRVYMDKEESAAKFGNYSTALMYQSKAAALSDLLLQIK